LVAPAILLPASKQYGRTRAPSFAHARASAIFSNNPGCLEHSPPGFQPAQAPAPDTGKDPEEGAPDLLIRKVTAVVVA